MDRQEREEAGRKAIESIESLPVSDVGDIVLNMANNISALRKNARFSEEERELFNKLDESFQELALGKDPGVEEEVEEVEDEIQKPPPMGFEKFPKKKTLISFLKNRKIEGPLFGLSVLGIVLAIYFNMFMLLILALGLGIHVLYEAFMKD